MDEVIWSGHRFQLCDYGGSWYDVGGVYIFTGFNQQLNLWVAQYIGQADSFRNRIPSHEQWNPAVRRGATHVHAMVVEQAATRDAIERTLILANQPPLNVQHRSPWAEIAQAAVRDRRFSQRNQGWSLADLFQPPQRGRGCRDPPALSFSAPTSFGLIRGY